MINILALLFIFGCGGSGGGGSSASSNVHQSDFMSLAMKSAIDAENWNEVYSLIDAGESVNIAEENTGLTPLHFAAMQDNADAIALLIEKGADKEKEDANGNRAIHIAIDTSVANRNRSNSLVALAKLIELNVNLNAKNGSGEAPIHIAAKKGLSTALDRLVTAGANKEIVDGEGNRPIHLAIKENKNSVVQSLLNNNVDIDASDSNGITAFQLASTKDTTTLLDIFITAFASNNNAKYDLSYQRNKDRANNRTALHIAAMNDNAAAITKLLEGVEDEELTDYLEELDSDGNMAIHVAAINDSSNAVSALKTKDATVITKTNISNRTSLYLCVENDSFNSFDDLVPDGFDETAEFDSDDNTGDTILHFAMRKNAANCVDNIKVLAENNDRLSNVFQAEYINNEGENPIHIASINNSAEALIKFLDVVEVEIGQTEKNNLIESLLSNKTPIMLAAEEGSAEAIAALKQKGANHFIWCNEETPLSLAVINDKAESIRAILEGEDFTTIKTKLEEKIYDDATLLHLAAINRSINAITELKNQYGNNREDMKVFVALGDNAGNTALYKAVDTNDLDSVNALLSGLTETEQKAYIGIENNISDTAIHFAAVDIVNKIYLVVAMKAGRDIVDSNGETILHILAAAGFGAEITSILEGVTGAARIALLSIKDNSGNTALHDAVYTNKLDSVNALLSGLTEVEQRTYIGIENNSDNTAIHYAASSDKVDLVVAMKAGRDIVDSGGETVLHILAAKGYGAVITSVLEGVTGAARIALLSIQDSIGETALHEALNEESVNALLSGLTDEEKNALIKIKSNDTNALYNAVNDQLKSAALVQAILDHVTDIDILTDSSNGYSGISIKERVDWVVDQSYNGAVDKKAAIYAQIAELTP